MYKDYRIEFLKSKMIKNLNPSTYFYIKDTLLFYVIQDKSQKLKQNFRNNPNMFTYSKIRNWKKKNPKFDENNLDLEYNQCKKCC